MNRPKAWALGAFLGAGLIASGAQATQHPWRADPHSSWGLGLVLGDPEGWGLTAKIWLDRDIALQPAVKFGWRGDGAVQLDWLWHDHRITGDRSWPVYFGPGAVLDTAGPAVGVRAIAGIAYFFPDWPGDLFVQLAPTYWPTGPGPAVQLYGEVGMRVYP